MSQSQKKSGAANISDLKARLGLKKGGPAAHTGVVPPPGGGIVPPPGVGGKAPVAVPVPPGAQPPAPEIPDASEDPFAAMNALASARVSHAAPGPDIVIVNDGKPVESVGNRSALLRFGVPAALALGAVLVGWILGQMSANSSMSERALQDAVSVGEDIKRLRRDSLQGIQDALWKSQESAPEGKPFPVNDDKLTQALGDKALWPTIDPEVFTKRFYELDGELVATIIEFYSNVITIRELVEAHVAATKNDVKAMEDGETKLKVAKPDEDVNRYLKFYRYGVVVDIPSKAEAEQGKQFGARLVEIGPPVCQDRRPSETGKCPDAPIGFGIRDLQSGGEGWGLIELGFPQDAAVPSAKLLPLIPSATFESLSKGAGPAVAEAAYLRRVAQLNELVKTTIEVGSTLEKQLGALK